MKHRQGSFFTSFFKTIDRVIFGIEEPKELEDQPEAGEWVKEEKVEDQVDRVVVRSSN